MAVLTGLKMMKPERLLMPRQLTIKHENPIIPTSFYPEQHPPTFTPPLSS
jgi:hypothetical protein